MRPPDTQIIWVKGLDLTANFNSIVENMVRPQDEFLWILGDDHVFENFLLLQLLAHDLDVVVPNVVERQAPFKPVVYSGTDGKNENGQDFYRVAQLPATGVHEVFAAGSAGMLIRRHVLDVLERPVFTTSGVHQNEDLNLCAKIRDAGFTIHCDVDAVMGHLGDICVFPLWAGTRWGTLLESAGKLIPLTPVEEEDEDNAA